MWGVRHSFWLCSAVGLAVATSVAMTAGGRLSSADLTVDELKAKLTSASTGDKAHLCIQIAQLQLTEADKLYAAANSEQAQPALTDVISFSEQARDYSIQSHKNQKQIEIAVRGMARKLTDLMHSLPHDEQAPLQDAIKRLQRVRDDLLIAMFPKGAK
jgi:hypothetical protein